MSNEPQQTNFNLKQLQRLHAALCPYCRSRVDLTRDEQNTRLLLYCEDCNKTFYQRLEWVVVNHEQD